MIVKVDIGAVADAKDFKKEMSESAKTLNNLIENDSNIDPFGQLKEIATHCLRIIELRKLALERPSN